MSDLNDLFAQLPIDKIAAMLGVDEQTAKEAVSAAVPALVGGMEANAQDEAGAASLQQALSQHEDRIGEGLIDLDGIDTDDGDKIVGHVFGDNRDQVAQQLGGMSGALSSGLIRKLLPMLAPIVMGYIAKRMRGGGGGGGQAQAQAGGGGLGDILGGLLRGGGGGGGGGGMLGGGGILDMLGGLLGGGRR